MKKLFTKGTALLLAVALIVVGCVYNNRSFFSATDELQTEVVEEQPTPDEVIEVVPEEEPVLQVEEVVELDVEASEEAQEESLEEPSGEEAFSEEEDSKEENVVEEPTEGTVEEEATEEEATEEEATEEEATEEEATEEEATEEETTEEETEEVSEKEKEVEKTEEVEEEKPQQTLKTTASDGAVIVVDAPEGSLPEGAYVKAVVVNSDSILQAVTASADAEGKEVTGYVAYDITIHDKDGNEIQPDNSVKVYISGASLSGEEASVYHVSDGNAEKVSEASSVSNVGFDASHFSVYTVVTTAKVSPADTVQSEALSFSVHKYQVVDGKVYIELKNGVNPINFDVIGLQSGETVTNYRIEDTNIAEIKKTNGQDQFIVNNTGETTLRIETSAGRAATLIIQVGRDTSSDAGDQTAYFYVVRPGLSITDADKEAGQAGKADANWYNMGTGTVKAPQLSTLGLGQKFEGSNIVMSMVQRDPGSYAEISLGDKKYTYSSKEAAKAGNYYIEWNRIVVESGANAGINNGPTAPSSQRTFHVDGTAVLIDPEYVTVMFKVKEPGQSDFKEVQAAAIIEKGSDYTKSLPQLDGTKKYNEVTYQRMDGWYTDENCTQKASFKNITEKTIFYTRYYASDFTVNVEGYSGTYDGQSHGLTTLKVPEGAEVKYSVKGSAVKTKTAPTITDAGSVTYDVHVTYDGKTIIIHDVTLTVTPKKAQIISKGTSKTYDGKPLTFKEYEVSGFIGDEGVKEVTITGTQTAPGSSKNTIKGYTLKENTKAGNYIIETVEEDLTVNPWTAKKEITVQGNTLEVPYDGKEHTVSGYTIENALEGSSNKFVFEGRSYRVEGISAKEVKATNVKITDGNVSTYELSVDVTNAKVYDDNNNDDVTSNFIFKPAKGGLKIKKRPLTITSATASKIYDGKDLIANDVTYEGLVSGEKLDVVFAEEARQLLPGTSNNEFTVANTVTAANYDITTKIGTLTVTDRTAKYPISVTANSDEVTYDGKEHTVSGYTIKDAVAGSTNKFVVGGNTYTVVSGLSATATGKNAGEYTVNVSVDNLVVEDEARNNVSKQFQVNQTPGKLDINPRTVVLESASASKPYDGTALEKKEVIIKEGSFVEGEGFTYEVSGSQTLVDSSNNTFSYKLNLKEGSSDKNYTIEKVEGTLTVTQPEKLYEVKVVAKSHSSKYNGAVQEFGGIDETTLKFTYNGNAFTIEGLEAKVNVKGGAKNAGTYTNTITGTAVVRDSAGEDVTKQFKVTPQNGTFEITKRKVTLTSASAEKEYDGSALTNNTVVVGGDNFVEGEGATYTVTGSQRIAGSSKNSFIYTLNGGTLAGNYEIVPSEGTLTVNNRAAKYQITVRSHSGIAKYDGIEKSIDGFKELGFAVDGNVYTVEGLTASVAATDAGTYSNTITGTPVVRDSEDKDVTDQFEVDLVPGELVIAKRILYIYSANDSKTFDGMPLKNKTITVKADGFVNGEGATYEVTGERTLPGTSENTFAYTLKEGTNPNNYDIRLVPGSLRIDSSNARYEISILANSSSVLYDGTEHTISGFGNTVFEHEGNKYTISGLTAEAKGTNAGTYTVKVEGTPVVTAADGTDVTSEFKVKTVDGTLSILKRQITFTSGSSQKEYDGYPLRNDEMTVTGDGFAYEEGATYTFNKIQTIVGNTANEFTVNWKEGTNPDNYEITVIPGTLTVTNANAQYKITVVANSASFTYDGYGKVINGFGTLKFEFAGETFKISGIGASAMAKDAGTYPSIVYGNAVVTDQNGNNVTDQFAITTQNGILSILPREITLVSEEASKVYDGTALIAPTISIEGAGFVEGEEPSFNVSGSQTLVGESQNTFDYYFGEGVKSENYRITKVEKTLKVTDREENDRIPVSITANSEEVPFDFMEHTLEGFETLETEYNGQKFYISGLTASATGTAVGEYPSVVEGLENVVVKDNQGNDVTKQFVVSTTDGMLKIVPSYYDLTIHYVDVNGKTVAADYTRSHEAGTQFRVNSPIVEGYTARYAYIQSPLEGMPAEDMEFTVVYYQNPPQAEPTPEGTTPPTDPEEPTPVVPTVTNPEVPTPVEPPTGDPQQPILPTPAAPELEIVPGEPVPLGGAILQAGEDGEYDLVAVEDTEIPLANQNLEEHNHLCCILHFMIMLAAMVVYGFYTNSHKKQQQKVHELREEYFRLTGKRTLDGEE